MNYRCIYNGCSCRGLTPEQGKARIIELARRCQQVQGIFTLLWHNTLLVGEQRAWVETYQEVLATLADMQGLAFAIKSNE